MKRIDISTPKYPNTFTEVDDSDFEWVNVDKWHAAEPRKGKLYARRTVRINGKRMALGMHVAILGEIEGKEIDHRDGNGLNNQRNNLRHCTTAENQMNSKKRVDSTSGYKGVSWSEDNKKWRPEITHNGKRIHLGYQFCLIKAAKCYDKAAKKYHGEFASLNFKEY